MDRLRSLVDKALASMRHRADRPKQKTGEGAKPNEGRRATTGAEWNRQSAERMRAILEKMSPKQVDKLLLLRDAYIDQVKRLEIQETSMRQAGRPAEAIARTLHTRRRRLGVRIKEMMPDAIREEIYRRNERRYGDKLGPTLEYYRGRGRSFEDIIRSAQKPGGMDLGVHSKARHEVSTERVAPRPGNRKSAKLPHPERKKSRRGRSR